MKDKNLASDDKGPVKLANGMSAYVIGCFW